MTPGGEPRAQLAMGTAVLAFLVLAVVFVLAIWPRLSFGGGDRVEVAFAHVGALKEGAPVIVAGAAIGRIEGITPVSIDGLPPGPRPPPRRSCAPKAPAAPMQTG